MIIGRLKRFTRRPLSIAAVTSHPGLRVRLLLPSAISETSHMTSTSPPLSSNDAVQLLDLLSSDDAFRTLFQADPAAALATISAEAGAGSCDCESGGPLASKEEFQAARTRLLAHLTATSSFSFPHCFVSGDIDSQLQRKPQP